MPLTIMIIIILYFMYLFIYFHSQYLFYLCIVQCNCLFIKSTVVIVFFKMLHLVYLNGFIYNYI